MGNCNACIRHHGAHLCGADVNAFNLIVNVIDLSAPPQLPFNRVSDNAAVVFQHIGLYRMPVHRGLLNCGHVADAADCHVERARNRRRGKRKHIHACEQLFKALLVFDAEALFFIDNSEAQIFEFDVLLHDAVRTNDNINLSARELFHDFLLLFRRAGAGKHLNVDGKAVKSL